MTELDTTGSVPNQEIRAALAGTQGQIGDVYRLLEQGYTTNRELSDHGGGANPGSAANARSAVETLLNGSLPRSPSVARGTASRIRSLVQRNSFTTETITYLNMLVAQLEEISYSEMAQAVEESELEEKSKALETKVGDRAGIYVYSLPTFLRVPQKLDPERYWFKIGRTERSADGRIVEQQRQAGLPEDYVLRRVYVPAAGTLNEAEKRFHDALIAFGHSRAEGRQAGREWFATNLDALDTVARMMGYQIFTEDEE
ncbi:MAG: GIY-YIG nuclease family protein [Acidimicrobiales bacterium]